MDDEFKKILPNIDPLKGIGESLKGTTKETMDILKGISSPAEELLKVIRSPTEDILKSIGSHENEMAKLFEDGQMRELLLPDLKMPTQEELNEYQSASVLMEALSGEALNWKQSLPDGYAPAIIAVLYGGIQIEVRSLAQVSFHGIRIEGTFNSNQCVMFAHQSTVQMLCLAVEVKEEEPRRPIGFIWDGHQVSV